MDEREDDARVRLDKWLWATRFYKTRALASEAIAGGKVQVNGDRAKRARPVQPGDEIRIRQGPYEHNVCSSESGDAVPTDLCSPPQPRKKGPDSSQVPSKDLWLLVLRRAGYVPNARGR